MIWPRNIQAFLSLLEEKLRTFYPQQEARAIVRYFWDYSFEVPWPFVWEEDMDFSLGQYELATKGAERLLNGEPVQYVVGWAHFYGYDFRVNEAVLIPRPETEGLVLWMKEEWLKVNAKKFPRLLDVGTGTGCIPLTLGLELLEKGLEVSAFYGMDLSEKAVEVARENAKDHPLLLHWIQQDIFQSKATDFDELDILVSNPPYIPQKERTEMDVNVKDHEPESALFVPDDDPLLFYKKIAALGLDWLKEGGRLFFEIHMDQGKAILEMLADMGYQKIEVRQDLGGRDRMAMGIRP